MKYYVETICGGPDAAGGGCGAPRDFSEVPKDWFEKTKGPKGFEPFEHTSSEAEECGYAGEGEIVLVFSPCRDCRMYC